MWKSWFYGQTINFDRSSSSPAGRISSASAVICFTHTIEKIEIQIKDCSKQIWDLLTAVRVSKGNHWTIGKSDVHCVFLRFGLDFGEHVWILEAFAFWIFAQELGAQSDEKDRCYVKTCCRDQNQRC